MSSKNPGTLRDFQIEGNDPALRKPRTLPVTKSVTKPVVGAASAAVSQPTKTPVQSIRPRVTTAVPATPNKASLTEWEDPDAFWSHWEKDFEDRRPESAAPKARAAAPSAAKPAIRTAPVTVAPATPVAATPAPATGQIDGKFDGKLVDTGELANAQAGQLTSEELGSVPWAVEVALQERRAERMGVVDFANAYQKQELLKKMTLEFMAALRKAFQEQIEVFNDSRKNPAQNIQLYRVSNTAEDFMVFRNGVKLVISGARAGRIAFAFNQFLGQLFAPRAQNTFELEATWGAFDQLVWNYRNERVEINDVVRYFVTEFSRQSFK